MYRARNTINGEVAHVQLPIGNLIADYLLQRKVSRQAPLLFETRQALWMDEVTRVYLLQRSVWISNPNCYIVALCLSKLLNAHAWSGLKVVDGSFLLFCEHFHF